MLVLTRREQRVCCAIFNSSRVESASKARKHREERALTHDARDRRSLSIQLKIMRTTTAMKAVRWDTDRPAKFRT